MFFIKKKQVLEIKEVLYEYKDSEKSKTDEIFETLAKYKNNESIENDYVKTYIFTIDKKDVKINDERCFEKGDMVVIEFFKDNYKIIGKQ